MMLLILTSVLGYELKTAVGTSVFIMTFTAFTGAVQPFYYRRDAGHKLPGTLYHFYLDLGRDRSPFRKQGRAYYSEPCYRSRTGNPGTGNDRGKFAMKAQSQSIGHGLPAVRWDYALETLTSMNKEAARPDCECWIRITEVRSTE